MGPLRIRPRGRSVGQSPEEGVVELGRKWCLPFALNNVIATFVAKRVRETRQDGAGGHLGHPLLPPQISL